MKWKMLSKTKSQTSQRSLEKKIIIITIILIISSVIFAISTTASLYNSSESPGWEDWPMWQRDTNHTGSYLGDLKNVSSVVNLWNYTAQNEFNNIPAIHNGVVFIGSKDKKIYALDLYTGVKKWEFDTSGFAFSGPAVADGQVYITSTSPYVFALDEETGVQLWNFSLVQSAEHIMVSVYKGVVIIPEKGNKLHLLNSTDGSEICSYTFSAPLYHSPAVAPDADGDVLVYAASSGNEMIGMYLSNCSAKWATTGGSDVKPVTYSDNIAYLPADNVLKAYYANNGSIMCTYTTPSGIFGQGLAVKGDYIVLTENSASNTVRLWKHNCSVNWTRSNPSTTGTSPIILNETSILFGMNNGQVQLINYSTGSALWNWSGAGNIFFNFGMADGIFMAGNINNKVHAFAQADQVTSISSSSSSSTSSSQSSYASSSLISSSSSSSTSSSSSIVSSSIQVSSSSSSLESSSSSSSKASYDSYASSLASSSSSTSSSSSSTSSSSGISSSTSQVLSSSSSSSSSKASYDTFISSLSSSSSSSSSSSIIASTSSSSSSSSTSSSSFLISTSSSELSSSSSELSTSSSSSSSSTSSSSFLISTSSSELSSSSISSLTSSSSSSSISSSSSSSTTLRISWQIMQTAAFIDTEDIFATTTTLRDIYVEYDPETPAWADCDEISNLEVATKIGCYLSVISSEFMNSASSLTDSITDLAQSITDGIAAIPGAMQDIVAQRFYEFVEAYGFTRQVIQNIFTFIFTLIWWFWGLCLVVTAFFWGGAFALFLLMEALFIIMAFGKKSRNPWNQMKKFFEYQMHMVYFIFKVAKKIYDLIYSIFSLLRGGGTTGT